MSSILFVHIIYVYLKFVGPLLIRNLGCEVDALVRLQPMLINLLD
jgi:hypothetical protein